MASRQPMMALRSSCCSTISPASAACGTLITVCADQKSTFQESSHRKSCSWLQPSSAENIAMKLSARGAAPTRNQGRRRPQRVRVRSEMKPMMGSLTPSMSLPTMRAIPANDALSATWSV